LLNNRKSKKKRKDRMKKEKERKWNRNYKNRGKEQRKCLKKIKVM
jgi:hypothetical protein